jgi:hypothetical protein
MLLLYSKSLSTISGLLPASGPASPDRQQALEADTDDLQTPIICRDGGLQPELARTYCHYTDTLLQGNTPGEHDKSMFLLGEELPMARGSRMGVDEAGTVPEGYFDAANQHVTHLQIVVLSKPHLTRLFQLPGSGLPFWTQAP